jgi:hypothetical protein
MQGNDEENRACDTKTASKIKVAPNNSLRLLLRTACSSTSSRGNLMHNNMWEF